MKSLTRAVLMVAAIVTTTLPGHARNVLIEKGEDGHPIVTPMPATAVATIPDIGGLPNDRFLYGTIGEIDSSVNVRFGRVEPYGRIAEHEGNSNYVLYVIRGSGSLVNTDGKGKEVSRFEFSDGDVITFRPYTMHYWENGDEVWEFIGVEQQAAQ